MFKKIDKYIYATIFISLIIGVFKMLDSNFFLITDVNISGENSILKEDILDKLENIKNKPIIYIDSSLLEEEIRKDIRVKEVSVTKRYPNEIDVNIVEREPVAIVKTKDFYILDKNLNVFSKLGEFEGIDLPIVYYDESNKEDIIKILDSLIASKIYPISSEIFAEEEHYVVLLDTNIKLLVNKKTSTKKFDQAFIVYNKERKLENGFEYIDLRFKDISVR